MKLICALNEEEIMWFMSRFRIEERKTHSKRNKKLKRKSANVKKMEMTQEFGNFLGGNCRFNLKGILGKFREKMVARYPVSNL